MKVSIKNTVAALLAVTGLSATAVQAEYLGLPNGRSANPGTLPDLSVELGFVTGKLGSSDYQNIGARVNYRLSPEIVLIGDLGIAEFGQTDGTPFGLGMLYFLSKQRITQSADIAAKLSYHTGEFDLGALSGDVDSLSFEVLISGKRPISASGVNWYGNVGLHRLSVDFSGGDSSTELGLGGGLTLPTDAGEAYAGFDFIDEMTIGLGFRYFVN